MKRIAHMLVGIALLGGCGMEPTQTLPADDSKSPATATSESSGATERADVGALRAATTRFHRIDLANAAGYDTQFPAGCFTSAAGAMGVHYLNKTRVGGLNVTEPQLLMYEPQKNGTMKLVGVEFIVPGVPTETAPVLFGQTFQYNATFGVWALHVWAWAKNPLGLFYDWNPNVTCAYATSVSAVAHH